FPGPVSSEADSSGRGPHPESSVSVLLAIDGDRRQQSPRAQLVEELTGAEQADLLRVAVDVQRRGDVERHRLAVPGEVVRLLSLWPHIRDVLAVDVQLDPAIRRTDRQVDFLALRQRGQRRVR